MVVASTASRTFVVTRDMVKRAMKLRKGRTLFFVDIAVPRNVEPAVHGIDNVYVFNVDDLEKEVARGLQARHAERGGRRGDRRGGARAVPRVDARPRGAADGRRDARQGARGALLPSWSARSGGA